jgi:recombination protein RecA
MAKKDDKRIDTIDALSIAMEKAFGDPLVELGEGMAQVETISFGLPSLDLITGVGGAPRGRIVEIYGPEGAGKTTLLVKLMAYAQLMAGKIPRMTYQGDKSKIKLLTGRVGLLDVEHAFDPSLAVLHGLRMGKGSGFYFDQPTGGDEAIEKLKMMIQSNLFDVIGIDSVAGLTVLEERNKEAGDKVIAGVAGLMSAELKKITAMANKSRTVVVFINQEREKPAVMFGSPITTTGGRALKFYASLRMRVTKKESLKDGDLQVGHTMGIKVTKNKVAPPFESTDIDLYYRETSKGAEAGFDVWSDLLKTGKDMGVIELGGSQYRYVDKSTGEVHKANGEVKWKEYLRSRPDVVSLIEYEILGDGIHGEIGEPDKQE